MIDLSKYEKIDGCEALKRLADGEHIFSKAGVKYKTNAHGFLFYLDYVEKKWKTSRIAFNNLVAQGFYIPKPFDIRQAMKEKPNEWVGAYEMNGWWYKVGFDTKNFMAVDTRIFNDAPTSFDLAEVDHVLSAELDDCIPLDDVPADAK